jgi:hypothetical protein
MRYTRVCISMATRSALSRTSAHAEAEPRYDDFFERQGAERADTMEGSSGVRSLPTREAGESGKLAALKSRIARTNAEPRNEVQERYDTLTVNRYEKEVCEAQELFIILKVRLARAGVQFDQYEAFIENPQRIRGERLFTGERSFGQLVADYKATKKRLVVERAMYEAACKRLHISVQEGSAHRKGASAKQQEVQNPFTEAQQKLASVYEHVVAKRDSITFDDAIILHETMVQGLRGLKLPGNEADLPASDRQALVAARYFCKQIEARLDQIRVRELRPVEQLAAEARLAATAGNKAHAAEKTAELSALLARIAPLYLLDSASESPRLLDLRSQYHLSHAELKELNDWIASKRITDSGKVSQRIDELVPRVKHLHQVAYPYGPCLSGAPLKAYVH